ncbi:VWA domain-containing protein [Candidatus Daviesbacteria bacterium]|nr:VWA domain-containing protein [Candidatus Daviesbacteria bacterium]
MTEGDLFFNFADLKPDDEGEDTISIIVEDNDAWACMDMTLTKDDDNTCTEPEQLDDPTCSEPNDDLFDGELGGLLNFLFWTDDGDNVLEDDEPIIASGSASTVLDSEIILADSTTNNVGGEAGDPLEGGQTYYIAKAFCFGELTPEPLDQDDANDQVSPANSSGGISCDGTAINNASQSDQLMADISFSAVQSRNNPDFLCGPIPSGSPSPSPTPQACNQADVMLVLDRSGSISPSELTQLKTAAKDFVDSLGLTPAGIHAGKSSFASLATLNHHLTDDPVSLKASIDAMVAGGFTNLKDGIDLARGELANPGDGHDRPDGPSPDKMIIITDGHPNRPLPASTADDQAALSADLARAAGSEIFVVGVGADVDDDYLRDEIADDAAHYYSASDYSGLQTSLENLDICDGE